MVTVTSITDASNLVLSSPQSIQNGTLLYFGISVTESETGTNLFYRDKDGTPGDQRYYRRDSLGIPNGKISNLGPGKYFTTVDNGLGCRKTFTFNISQPDELFAQAIMTQPVQCFGFDDGTRNIPTGVFDNSKKDLTKKLSEDINEMEKMLNEYLQFTSSSYIEKDEMFNLSDLIEEIISKYNNVSQEFIILDKQGLNISSQLNTDRSLSMHQQSITFYSWFHLL